MCLLLCEADGNLCVKKSKTPNTAIDKRGSFLYNYSTIVALLKGGFQGGRGRDGGWGVAANAKFPK